MERTSFSTGQPDLSNHFSDYGASAPRGTFASQHIDPNLQALENEAEFQSQFPPQLAPHDGGQLQLGTLFAHRNISEAPYQHIKPQVAPQQSPTHDGPPVPQQPSREQPGVALDLLTPQAQATSHDLARQPALDRIQRENDHMQERMASGLGKKYGAHFRGMKLVRDPPDLDQWREKLFNVGGTITLTEDEYVPSIKLLALPNVARLADTFRFQTYFPHVDNIYSHRSTQRYKRKPFVSHYWDCRLKGRPPGTPKTSDPSKKKRKRVARELNLCDVKIKITEYFPGAKTMMGQLGIGPNDGEGDGLVAARENFDTSMDQDQNFGATGQPGGNETDIPGTNGERYFAITRINGLGGKTRGDGIPGGHKHSLEESDRVKKSSVARHLLNEKKQRGKPQVCGRFPFTVDRPRRAGVVDWQRMQLLNQQPLRAPLHVIASIAASSGWGLVGKCFVFQLILPFRVLILLLRFLDICEDVPNTLPP